MKKANTSNNKVLNNNPLNSIDLNNVIDDVDLNKLFSGELGSDTDVLKELFDTNNIKTKTDLTINQISIIARLEFQSKITNNTYLSFVIKEFETLLVSKNRLSRSEFVNAFRGIGDTKSGVSLMDKFTNVFRNDK